METSTSLFLGVLFGSIGLGYIVYGKKQHKGIALLSGVGLCALPYLISSVLLVILAAIVLMVLPFLMKY